MKRITLSLFAIIPVALFAQAPAPSSSFDEGGGKLLMVVIALIIIFFVCRELICWYYKINKMVSNQEEIIRLLKKIANENNTPTNETKLGEDKKSIIEELTDSTKFMVTGK